jgi:hypothetical protein
MKLVASFTSFKVAEMRLIATSTSQKDAPTKQRT